MTEKGRTLGVDAKGFSEVYFCQTKFLLFLINHANTIPEMVV